VLLETRSLLKRGHSRYANALDVCVAALHAPEERFLNSPPPTRTARSGRLMHVLVYHSRKQHA